jgi:hypothetical protein
VWGISADDGTSLEAYVDDGGERSTVDGDGRRAGENLAGDVLLYHPCRPTRRLERGPLGLERLAASADDAHHQPEPPRTWTSLPAALRGRGLVAADGSGRIGATDAGSDFTPRAHPRRFIVHVLNRGVDAATGVVLDAQRGPRAAASSPPRSTAPAELPCDLGRPRARRG